MGNKTGNMIEMGNKTGNMIEMGNEKENMCETENMIDIRNSEENFGENLINENEKRKEEEESNVYSMKLEEDRIKKDLKEKFEIKKYHFGGMDKERYIEIENKICLFPSKYFSYIYMREKYIFSSGTCVFNFLKWSNNFCALESIIAHLYNSFRDQIDEIFSFMVDKNPTSKSLLAKAVSLIFKTIDLSISNSKNIILEEKNENQLKFPKLNEILRKKMKENEEQKNIDLISNQLKKIWMICFLFCMKYQEQRMITFQ